MHNYINYAKLLALPCCVMLVIGCNNPAEDVFFSTRRIYEQSEPSQSSAPQSLRLQSIKNAISGASPSDFENPKLVFASLSRDPRNPIATFSWIALKPARITFALQNQITGYKSELTVSQADHDANLETSQTECVFHARFYIHGNQQLSQLVDDEGQAIFAYVTATESSASAKKIPVHVQ